MFVWLFGRVASPRAAVVLSASEGAQKHHGTTRQWNEKTSHQSTTGDSRLAISPKLVEAVDAGSIRGLCASSKAKIIYTHAGDVFAWGPVSFEAVKHAQEVEEQAAEISKQQLQQHLNHASSGAAMEQEVGVAATPFTNAIDSRDAAVKTKAVGTATCSGVEAASAADAETAGAVATSNTPAILSNCNAMTTAQTSLVATRSTKFRPWALSLKEDAVAFMTLNGGDIYVVMSSGRVNVWRIQGCCTVPDLMAPIACTTEPISSIACGADFTLAVTHGGRVLSWGRDRHGVLGHGSSCRKGPGDRAVTVPTPIFSMQHLFVQRVAVGWAHALAITDTGILYAWGCGRHGALGTGSEKDENEPVRIDVREFHSMQEIDPASGLPMHRSISAPTNARHQSERHRSGGPPPKAKFTGAGRIPGDAGSADPLVMAVCGYHHSVVLDASGCVFVWGGNDKGQLGLGHRENVMHPTIVRFKRGRRATLDAAAHAAVIAMRARSVSEDMEIGTPPVVLPGSATSTSSSLHPGAFVTAAEQPHVVSISSGAFHSAAVTAVGELWVWGWGRYGQLGLGDTKSRIAPRVLTALSSKEVSLVTCGADHTLVVTKNFMVVQSNYFGGKENNDNEDSNSSAGAQRTPLPDTHSNSMLSPSSQGGDVSSRSRTPSQVRGDGDRMVSGSSSGRDCGGSGVALPDSRSSPNIAALVTSRPRPRRWSDGDASHSHAAANGYEDGDTADGVHGAGFDGGGPMFAEAHDDAAPVLFAEASPLKRGGRDLDDLDAPLPAATGVSEDTNAMRGARRSGRGERTCAVGDEAAQRNLYRALVADGFTNKPPLSSKKAGNNAPDALGSHAKVDSSGRPRRNSKRKKMTKRRGGSIFSVLSRLRAKDKAAYDDDDGGDDSGNNIEDLQVHDDSGSGAAAVAISVARGEQTTRVRAASMRSNVSSNASRRLREPVKQKAPSATGGNGGDARRVHDGDMRLKKSKKGRRRAWFEKEPTIYDLVARVLRPRRRDSAHIMAAFDKAASSAVASHAGVDALHTMGIMDRLDSTSAPPAVLSASVNYRPVNLPPKTPAEAAKHKREVRQMSRMYRVKLQKEAKDKALAKQQQLEDDRKVERDVVRQRKQYEEREQKLESAAAFWANSIVPFWDRCTGVDRQGATTRNKRDWVRALDLVWKVGIPPRTRGDVWPLALGNALRITEDLYDIFGEHALRARRERRKKLEEVEAKAREVREGSSMGATAGTGGGGFGDESTGTATAMTAKTSKSKQESFAYIDTDLYRTFPSLSFFQEGCPMYDDLRRLLDTYCFFRPDIGYVQGMSYLAGNFLLYMPPLRAFQCFANLLNSPFFHVFLKLNPVDMNSRFELFHDLLQAHAPTLCSYLDDLGVGPDLYFMEWSMTLFCKRLKLEVVGRVWDAYLIVGEEVVYRAAVSILKILQPSLLDQPFEVVMKVLTSQPQRIGEAELFDVIRNVKLSHSLLSRLIALRSRKAL